MNLITRSPVISRVWRKAFSEKNAAPLAKVAYIYDPALQRWNQLALVTWWVT